MRAKARSVSLRAETRADLSKRKESAAMKLILLHLLSEKHYLFIKSTFITHFKDSSTLSEKPISRISMIQTGVHAFPTTQPSQH